jgi:hypothetical protein
MDRARRQFHRYFFGDAAAIIREIVTREPAAASARGADKPVLTLARELGAGDQGFAPPLAERLGLDIVDRDLLEEEAERGRPGACGIRGHAALGRCGGRAVRPASSGRALESRVHCR